MVASYSRCFAEYELRYKKQMACQCLCVCIYSIKLEIFITVPCGKNLYMKACVCMPEVLSCIYVKYILIIRKRRRQTCTAMSRRFGCGARCFRVWECAGARGGDGGDASDQGRGLAGNGRAGDDTHDVWQRDAGAPCCVGTRRERRAGFAYPPERARRCRFPLGEKSPEDAPSAEERQVSTRHRTAAVRERR